MVLWLNRQILEMFYITHGSGAITWFCHGFWTQFRRNYLQVLYIYKYCWRNVDRSKIEIFFLWNGLRVFQLQKAISSLPQENVSVSDYFTCLEGLWDELSILFFFLLLSSFLDPKHFVFSSSTLFHAASSNSKMIILGLSIPELLIIWSVLFHISPELGLLL